MIAVAGHFHGGDAGDGADLRHQFGGDLLGRLAQLFGELEGDGDGHFAEIALARLLHAAPPVRRRSGSECVHGKRFGDLLFNGMEHGKLRV